MENNRREKDKLEIFVFEIISIEIYLLTFNQRV